MVRLDSTGASSSLKRLPGPIEHLAVCARQNAAGRTEGLELLDALLQAPSAHLELDCNDLAFSSGDEVYGSSSPDQLLLRDFISVAATGVREDRAPVSMDEPAGTRRGSLSADRIQACGGWLQ